MGPDRHIMYVPYSPDDEDWGLYILDVGKASTPPGSNYPVGDHPPEYIFHFSRGRVLSEYQLVYVHEGKGVFESEFAGKIRVTEGSMIVLWPGMWHRYRPDRDTGWTEAWIGFNGEMADHILSAPRFLKEHPIINVGIQSDMIRIYDQVLFECRQGDPGYQQVAAGKLVELLGLIMRCKKSGGFVNRTIRTQINDARSLIEERFKSEIDPVDIAEEVGMSYSNFRKQFRMYTGLSPVQYIIQLRIREAKSVLFRTNKPVKEIASELGFKTSYYFIRLFRNKTGMTPGSFRQMARGVQK